MSLKIIQAQNAPAAIGPYLQAIVTGGMLLTSGQLGIDPLTNALPEGIEAQTSVRVGNKGPLRVGNKGPTRVGNKRANLSRI